MKALFLLLLAFSILFSVSLVHSQRSTVETSRKETMQYQQLQKLLSNVGVNVAEFKPTSNQPQTYREVKIRWADSTGKSTKQTITSEAQRPAPSVSLVEDNKRSGTMPRHRSVELAPTHIFIAAVDEASKLRWWSIVPDPRLIRSETQTPSGELRSQNLYLSNFTMLVAFPDDPQIANLRFYHPEWTGTDFNLKLLAVVPTR